MINYIRSKRSKYLLENFYPTANLSEIDAKDMAYNIMDLIIKNSTMFYILRIE